MTKSCNKEVNFGENQREETDRMGNGCLLPNKVPFFIMWKITSQTTLLLMIHTTARPSRTPESLIR